MRKFITVGAAAGALAAASAALAQPASVPSGIAPSAAIAPAPAAPAMAASAQSVLIPEGTEMVVRFGQQVSSGTNAPGDTFEVILAEPVRLPDGTILEAGYRGRGEVVHAKRRGHMGKAGELNVRISYLRVGADRVPLRASKGAEGKGSVGSAVALTVLFGPVGLLARGADIVINEGQTMTAFVDEDTRLPGPLTAR